MNTLRLSIINLHAPCRNHITLDLSCIASGNRGIQRDNFIIV